MADAVQWLTPFLASLFEWLTPFNFVEGFAVLASLFEWLRPFEWFKPFQTTLNNIKQHQTTSRIIIEFQLPK